MAASGHAWQRKFADNPFQLGVASGDPSSDGFVIWTRLAPEPLLGGGMPDENVPVNWEVAADERMSRIVKKGLAVATPQLSHSIHVEVEGLQPNRWYWYRFNTGGVESPVGRSRTFPRLGDSANRLKFAFASCQHFEQGLYTAYQHMAEEDLDLVVHLGDYIYEGQMVQGRVRQHLGGEAVTIHGYRNRYAQYKSDPLLQRAHALFPWIITPDDHEVQNNYANDISQSDDPREQFLMRRASAYQAFYEHMPFRRNSLPKAASMQLYRRLAFGNLAEFQVLDTRQYRTDQPCGDGTRPHCPESLAEGTTLLGPAQERWLMDGLDQSRARWNLLANQVRITKVDLAEGADEHFNMDDWGGNEAARMRLSRFLSQRRPSNPVIITGNHHSNWVCDLKMDFRNLVSPTLATEFVGTSISSGGDGADTVAPVPINLAENPQIKFFNNQRGYVRCTITPEQWQTDFRVVPYVTRPGAPISTRASFVVEDGQPGAQPA